MFLVLLVTASATLGIWWASFGRLLLLDKISTSTYVIGSLVIMLSLATILTMLNMTIVQIVRSAQHWLKLLEYEQPDITKIPWWLALHRARPDPQSRPYIGGGGFSLCALEPLLLAFKTISGRPRNWYQLSDYFRRQHDGEIALEQTEEESEQRQRREREEQTRRRERAWQHGQRFGRASFAFAKDRLRPLLTMPFSWIIKLSDRVANFQTTQDQQRLARRQQISLD